MVCALVLLGLALSATESPGSAAAAEVAALRTEQVVNPLGIEDPSPNLDWELRSTRRGERQSAYRVQVAESVSSLSTGAYLWDSGRVDSAQSIGVPYAGPPLESARRYFWRVKVWDGLGAESEWSEPAWWEMGLLAPGDWQGAEWISPKATTGADSWTDYELGVDFRIASGAAGVVFRASDPSNFYMWQVNIGGGEVLLRPHLLQDGEWDVLDEVDISAALPPAEANASHRLEIEADGQTITTSIDGEQVDEREIAAQAAGAIGFRSGNASEVASFDNLVVRDLADGAELFGDDFEGAPDPAFPGAAVEDGELHVRDGDLRLISTAPAVPLLRKEFEVARPLAEVSSARAYSYGLGFYELYLSGTKVGDRVLTPPMTEFGERLRYQSYDATSLLSEGDNALGLVLAEGYGPSFSRFSSRWLGPRQALVLLDIAYDDGTHQHVVSDETWRWSDGPHRAASIYGGETYDARLELPGWDTAGFDDGDWQAVRTVEPPGGELEADPTTPIRVVETRRPVALTEPDPGVYVFDLGQNVSGWARLRAHGPEGAHVRLRYAEELAPDGTLDTFTNRRADATDVYVLAGQGDEEFEPSFTYHGFRYVEVTGLPYPPTLDTIDGRVVHADLHPTVAFDSSSPLLDRIYANNRRTIANNAMSYPTDNPVRDERTGPAMDVHAHLDATVRDFDASRFLGAYLDEIDAIHGGSPDMNGAHVPLAWALYEQYGDRDALNAAYPGMTAAVDEYEDEAVDGIWQEGDESDRNGFGDWCPPVPEPAALGGLGGPHVGGYEDCFSEVSLVNSALGYRAARIVARAATALGIAADAGHYEAVADWLRDRFEEHFATAAGYGSGRQVTSVLPLAFGMVPADRRATVGLALANRVLGKDGGHLDTGIFGTRYLIDALVAAGRPDVAMTVLGQTSYPGFGFQIGLGATTAWEQWLRRSSMQTQDHAMFAGINASFVTELAGIEPTSPSYETIQIAPALPPQLEHVSTSLQTVRGEVASEWRRTAAGLELNVTVPPNARATVRIPVGPGDQVRESGRPAGESTGVTPVAAGDTAEVYEVGAGTYRFTATPPPDPGPQTEGAGGQGPGTEVQGSTPARSHLRFSARSLAARRLSLLILCRAGCPSHGSGIRLAIFPRAGRAPIATARTRLHLRRRLVVRARAPIPRRLRIEVSGLEGGPVSAEVPVARRRR